MNKQLIPSARGLRHHAGWREIIEAFHRLQQHFGEEISRVTPGAARAEACVRPPRARASLRGQTLLELTSAMGRELLRGLTSRAAAPVSRCGGRAPL